MLKQEFEKAIKAKRLTRDWYQFTGSVEGKDVALKGYKIWLQIYHVDGGDYSNIPDVSVKQFNTDLSLPFKEMRESR